MPLTSIEAKPIPSLDWLQFLWLPSRRQTEKARKEVKKDECPYLAYPIVEAFADGRLNIGSKVRIGGRVLVLEGVYPKAEFPEAMVFWDRNKRRHVQFTTWGISDDFLIIPE